MGGKARLREGAAWLWEGASREDVVGGHCLGRNLWEGAAWGDVVGRRFPGRRCGRALPGKESVGERCLGSTCWNALPGCSGSQDACLSSIMRSAGVQLPLAWLAAHARPAVYTWQRAQPSASFMNGK